jgi:exopolysaccharide biosynthesis predicted pyruvyltransferase EpsI
MGTRYFYNWELRRKVLQLGLPVTIFPQSFTSPEDRPYKRIFVRERGSLKFCPQAVLAPDLALGLDYENSVAPTRKLGVFLRGDEERAVRRPWFSRDPAKICRTPQEYLRLAARYERIITDRLHFAICGLIVGRETTLLPNAYHKNQAMYDTWLKSLGCRLAESAKEPYATEKADGATGHTSWTY